MFVCMKNTVLLVCHKTNTVLGLVLCCISLLTFPLCCIFHTSVRILYSNIMLLLHIEKWARCFRKFAHADTDMNMYLERYAITNMHTIEHVSIVLREM